jgi:hypothetical protein
MRPHILAIFPAYFLEAWVVYSKRNCACAYESVVPSAKLCKALMAQQLRRLSSYLEVVGSIPASSILFSFE